MYIKKSLLSALLICIIGYALGTSLKKNYHASYTLANVVSSQLEACTKLFCAKCGQVLECYVNSCDPIVDKAVCDIVESVSDFCNGQGGLTKCGQSCRGPQGVKCYTGLSWSSCPAKIGISECIEGAAGKNGKDVLSATLSNFAVYKVCPSSDPADFDCIEEKCDGNRETECSCAAEKPPLRPICSPGVAAIDTFV